jgi:hypothetical protein
VEDAFARQFIENDSIQALSNENCESPEISEERS